MWQKIWFAVVATVIGVSMPALFSCAGDQQSVIQSPEQAVDAPQGAKSLLFPSEAGTVSEVKTSTSASTASPPRRSPPRRAAGETEGPKVRWLGIAYWVEWERPGVAPTRIADPSRFVFQSGDRVRIHVMANTEGYLYVVNRGTSGQGTVLFPHAGMVEQHPRVVARKEYIVPSQGWIKFDTRPGEEGIRFILSQVPVPDVLGVLQNPIVSPADSGRLMAALDQRGAKDLLVEADDTKEREATYLGAKLPLVAGDSQAGPLVIYDTRLFHQ